jgi:acyl carrier protein
LPELDSFAVLSLAAALESRFGIHIDDEDFSAELFETVGSLAAFVDRHRPKAEIAVG